MSFWSKIYWVRNDDNKVVPILANSKWKPSDKATQNCVEIVSGMTLEVRKAFGVQPEGFKVRVDERGRVFLFRHSNWSNGRFQKSKRRSWCEVSQGATQSENYLCKSGSDYRIVEG